ncbi:MAG: 3-deoxy-8-phosphooctulonate synthase [Ignavibacteriaceae bacterium]|nr:3-deoxy-8-phosphooctulonate synthase [Ignavibacteriaceae bacterium]
MIKLNSLKIGNNNPFVLIAGPCVVENEKMILQAAGSIKAVTKKLNIPFIFKSSYKKANRTSGNSFTGIGNTDALKILLKVKEVFDVPVITDIHTAEEAELAAEYVDILQIPAFLCRQTDLLLAAGKTKKIVNIKKGQFLAPEDMKFAIEKVKSTGNKKVLLTERGTTFGYHNLVVDMRSLVIMKKFGYPIVMDATHSVQLPSAGNKSGGQPEFILPLAKAAAAVGIDALFLEVHPNPKKALSDADSQLKLDKLGEVLKQVQKIDKAVKGY